ncbi:MAG: hypothetical protein K5907_02305 [Treponema sp.]|nr:hypothetical protein [Treponema sp.]
MIKLNNAKKITALVCGALLMLQFTGCYTWYESKTDMDTKTQKINLNDLFYKEKEVTELSIPKQLFVSKGMYSGTVKLHWDEVPYATSYRVERAVVSPDPESGEVTVPEEGDFEVINKYVYTNNYNDLILPSPGSQNKQYEKFYYYRVSAENIKQGLESSEFTPISNDTRGWLLRPPSAIEADKGESTEYITVTWSGVPDAASYIIYRGEKENGLGMEFLDSVKGNKNSYRNELTASEKGVEFYYKVCAVLSSGSESAFTGLALGYSGKEGAPTCPENIQVTNGKGKSLDKLTITWDAFNAGNNYDDVKYTIYRTSDTDTIYKLVSNGVTGTSFTDSSVLKPGVKYYYYVQTIATAKTGENAGQALKSSFSKTGPGAAVPAVGWLLSAPSSCEVADSSNPVKVKIRWSPAVGYDDADVSYSYNIYYSNSINFDESYEVALHLTKDDPTVTVDSDGYYSYETERHPYFRIVTNNGDIGQSAPGTIIAPCPKAPVNVAASKTSGLDGLQNYNANTNGVYPVKITWAPPADDTPAGYHVYRSTKPDSSFRKISDEPVTGTLEFIDNNETARAGTFYYYKVVSLNLLGQGKKSNDQSEDTRGYGALTRDQWFREYNKTVKKSQTKLTLMHKSKDTDKLGSESVNGEISGSLSYNAKIDGLGARILMHYNNYADLYAGGNSDFGIAFLITGDTNTSANMSANGTMDGTVTAANSGMYPGYAKYNSLEIKGGRAGGGYYLVSTRNKNGDTILSEGNVDWAVGEEN